MLVKIGYLGNASLRIAIGVKQQARTSHTKICRKGILSKENLWSKDTIMLTSLVC